MDGADHLYWKIRIEPHSDDRKRLRGKPQTGCEYETQTAIPKKYMRRMVTANLDVS